MRRRQRKSFKLLAASNEPTNAVRLFAMLDGQAQVSVYLVTVLPGDHSAWHHHEVPLLVHVLDGELTVDYGDKGKKTFKAGDAFMEALETRHEGLNTSDKPTRLLAVYMGSEARSGQGETGVRRTVRSRRCWLRSTGNRSWPRWRAPTSSTP